MSDIRDHSSSVRSKQTGPSDQQETPRPAGTRRLGPREIVNHYGNRSVIFTKKHTEFQISEFRKLYFQQEAEC